jgi:hypothetical protein
MHTAPPASHDAPDRATVPSQTTPTWEMELLVSGATIFGLLQLPELVDRAYVRTLNLSPDDYATLLTPLWMYSKFAIVTLVVTFIVHLCLRGYWVALVGLDSVYRGGIRWDRLERGPLARASSERASAPMPVVIERADNRATRVFAIGFGFAMVMLMPVAIVLLSLVASVAVDAAFGPGHAGEVFGAVVAMVLLPWAISRFLDKHVGARLAPDSPTALALGRVLGLYARLGMGRGSNPLVALFVSHEGRARAGVAAMAMILPVMIVLAVQMSIARGRLPLGFFVGLSAEDPTSADASAAAFYADSRGESPAVLPLPRIPSRIAGGAYVELFVPFIPRLHGPSLQASCPDALKVVGIGSTRARLDCLARVTDLRLDGAPLAIRLDASTDPRSGQPGMLAMVPVAGLAPGRHELSLAAPDRKGAGTRRYRIPFWR